MLIAYNRPLLTEKRDFERARMYAQKAYAGGMQLPGLRESLLDRANGSSNSRSRFKKLPCYVRRQSTQSSRSA